MTLKSDLEYYYVTYHGTNLYGAIIIPQNKVPDQVENPDGFNITGATRILNKIYGPTIVLSWVRVSEKRATEFTDMVMSIKNTEAPKPAHLSLVNVKEEDPK